MEIKDSFIFQQGYKKGLTDGTAAQRKLLDDEYQKVVADRVRFRRFAFAFSGGFLILFIFQMYRLVVAW